MLHREFVLSFGFTRRDTARIKAMAERTTRNNCEVALNDLDVAYRVGACMIGDERHSSGLVLGEWAGRTLLYWEMLGSERDRWASGCRGGKASVIGPQPDSPNVNNGRQRPGLATPVCDNI